MTDTPFPMWLYRAGYTDLISVIPPGAPLLPGSRMQASSLGKAPGIRTARGWSGYNWRSHNADEEDVAAWVKDGASFGLRADRFPGLDIDVMDNELAAEVQALAFAILGPAPVRYGRRPKRLLMYRSADSIARMRLWLEKDGASHLVELLGAGQQYLVHGIHPVTNMPYAWDTAGLPFPAPASLRSITRAQVEALFARIAEAYGGRGWTVYREGDGYARGADTKVDQAALRAPSIDALGDLVDKLPNDDQHYPGRDAYIRVGYAIRAAAGDHVEEGYDIFASWASRHPKDARVRGNPQTWRDDYDRMKPPYAIGWPWLRDEAQRVGQNTAQEDFDAVFPTQPAEVVPQPATPDGVLANGDLVGYALAEWQEHPEYAEMPPSVIPHFAWRGLKTLFSGREKIGKSTLLLAGAAAVSAGADFLGDGTEQQKVLWLTEEAVVLPILRAKEKGADPDRFIITPMGKDPRMQLAHAMNRYRPTVVVIDTLFRYAGVDDENNASQWHPFLKDFDSVTRTGAALVFIVHALKSREDGSYRGSSALGAWVDVIIAMADPIAESTTRRLAAKGRVNADAFSVRYDQGVFRLLTDEQRADARVTARENKLLAWVAAGTLSGHKYKAAELDALAARGLLKKTRRIWSLTTSAERARKDFGQ